MANALENFIDTGAPIARGAALGLQMFTARSRSEQAAQMLEERRRQHDERIALQAENLDLRRALGEASLGLREQDLLRRQSEADAKIAGLGDAAAAETALAQGLGMFAPGGDQPPIPYANQPDDSSMAEAFSRASPSARSTLLQNFLMNERPARVAEAKSKASTAIETRRLAELDNIELSIEKHISEHPDAATDPALQTKRAAIRLVRANPKTNMISAEASIRAIMKAHPQIFTDPEQAADFVMASGPTPLNELGAPGAGNQKLYDPSKDPVYVQLDEQYNEASRLVNSLAGNPTTQAVAAREAAMKAKDEAFRAKFEHWTRMQGRPQTATMQPQMPGFANQPAAAPGFTGPPASAANPNSGAAAVPPQIRDAAMQMGLTEAHLGQIAQWKAQGKSTAEIIQLLRGQPR